MSSMRFLFVIALLITTISCSDDKSSPAKKSSPAPEGTETPTTAETTNPLPHTNNEFDTAPTPTVTDKYLDLYSSVLIQEIRNQISKDPAIHANKLLNVEFANRIFKVNFIQGRQPKLSFVTHSAKAYDFQLVNTKGKHQFFNAYKASKGIYSNERVKEVVYTAEVHNVRTEKNKSVAIIKFKDIQSNAIVHLFYIHKSGTVQTRYLTGNDYASELTKTSKVFLQRVLENNSVVGEFYGVITEERNISNASRFNLTVSDNFLLLSQPISGHLRPDQPNVIPMITDYKSFWKMFFFGSTAYQVIKDASYIIESERNPVELKALNIDLRIEAIEKVQGKSNTLPIKFFVEFK